MNEQIEEKYTDEGKTILELVQEWIYENTSFLYCQAIENDVKYFHG